MAQVEDRLLEMVAVDESKFDLFPKEGGRSMGRHDHTNDLIQMGGIEVADSADARTRGFVMGGLRDGFVTVAEMAVELGIKWDHVLTWIDKAGVELVDLLPAGAKAYRHLAAKRKSLGIAGRCGVYTPDDEAVETAYQEWIDQIEAENAERQRRPPRPSINGCLRSRSPAKPRRTAPGSTIGNGRGLSG